MSYDLDEAFAPYGHPLGISARQARKVWRTAAYASGVRGHVLAALEASVNGMRRFPPERWRSGVALLREVSS